MQLMVVLFWQVVSLFLINQRILQNCIYREQGTDIYSKHLSKWYN